MAEKDIVVPELDADGRITAGSVIEQIEEIAAEAAPPLDLSGGQDGAVAIGGEYSRAPEDAPGARVYGSLGIAIGARAEAGPLAVAIGGPASGTGSVAVGASTEGDMATAVGGGAAKGTGATSLGYGALALGTNSVALGPYAAAENDHDFVLGTKNHNVKVPGTLSIQSPEEPQHAVTKGYVDNAVASAGGGDWVAVQSLTPPADWEYAAATLWVANPGGISLIEAGASIPAGPGGEQHEFTLDLDALPPHAQDLIANMRGQGIAILTGIDEDTLEPTPVLAQVNVNLTLTPLADHGLLSVYGTLLFPTRRGSLD